MHWELWQEETRFLRVLTFAFRRSLERVRNSSSGYKIPGRCDQIMAFCNRRYSVGKHGGRKFVVFGFGFCDSEELGEVYQNPITGAKFKGWIQNYGPLQSEQFHSDVWHKELRSLGILTFAVSGSCGSAPRFLSGAQIFLDWIQYDGILYTAIFH